MSGTGNRVSPLQVSTLESILNVLKSDNGEGNKESNKESKPTRILVSPKNDSKVLNQKFSQAQVNIIRIKYYISRITQGVHFIYQLLLFPFHLFSLTLFLLLCFIVGEEVADYDTLQ